MGFGIMAQPSSKSLGEQWAEAAKTARKTDGTKYPALKKARERKAEQLHRRYLDAFQTEVRRRLDGGSGAHH